MQTTTQQNRETERIGHPISKEDKAAMTAMRAIVEPQKGRLQGTDARGAFDAIMSRVVAPVGVTFAPGTVGGVAGWWCRPERSRTGQAILHLHGGWFNWGSAQAFRNLVGHIAACAGVEAFVPDYRLAPEHRFPAATEDVRACYLGLIKLGFSGVAITGDSPGGNLALGLLHFAAAQERRAGRVQWPQWRFRRSPTWPSRDQVGRHVPQPIPISSVRRWPSSYVLISAVMIRRIHWPLHCMAYSLGCRRSASTSETVKCCSTTRCVMSSGLLRLG